MEKVNPIIDNIIESLQGGREKRISNTFTAKYRTIEENTVMSYLKTEKFWLENIVQGFLDEKETDILNMRDEILAALKRLMYLFTLK